MNCSVMMKGVKRVHTLNIICNLLSWRWWWMEG